MAWQPTLFLQINKTGSYQPLNLAGLGGKVPIEIASFGLDEKGLYEVGIYSLPNTEDFALVCPAQQAYIARYRRHLIFEVPPSIEALHVGARLLVHDELDTKSYYHSLRWQKPFGSGSIPVAGGTFTTFLQGGQTTLDPDGAYTTVFTFSTGFGNRHFSTIGIFEHGTVDQKIEALEERVDVDTVRVTISALSPPQENQYSAVFSIASPN